MVIKEKSSLQQCHVCGVAKTVDAFLRPGCVAIRSNTPCLDCFKLRARVKANGNYARHREAVKARVAANRAADPTKHRTRVKSWKRRHPEEVRLQHERHNRRLGAQPKWAIYRHDAHIKAFRSWLSAWNAARKANLPWTGLSSGETYRVRYRSDPDFRLKECLRRQMRKQSQAVPELAEVIRLAMRAGARSRRVERLVGYSIAQLRHHLERQFVRSMSWSSFGNTGWHIDHILPRKCFDLTTIEGVRAYWSLSNLRPLAARENIAKSAKVLFLV